VDQPGQDVGPAAASGTADRPPVLLGEVEQLPVYDSLMGVLLDDPVAGVVDPLLFGFVGDIGVPEADGVAQVLLYVSCTLLLSSLKSIDLSVYCWQLNKFAVI